MSVLVVEIVDKGIIFAADRAISQGSVNVDNRRKVIYLPENKGLVGYCGLAELNGKDMDVWLKEYLIDNNRCNSLEALARDLTSEVERQVRVDLGNNPVELMIDIGGFGKKEGHSVPEIWYISNVHGIDDKTGGYVNIDTNFGCSEQFSPHCRDVQPANVQNALRALSQKLEPLWFHHCIDLPKFNIFSTFLRHSFKHLYRLLPNDIPKDLSDWEKHTKMQILMYGAYYEAFYPEGKRPVGGGCDAVTMPWPSG